MALNEASKKKLISLVTKFKLVELEYLFNKDICQISANDINRCIYEFKLPQSPKSVAEAFIYLYEKKRPSLEQIEYFFYYMYVYDLALHKYNKIKWATASMEHQMKDLPETLNDLNAIICQSYDASVETITVSVYSVYESKVVWIVIIPKLKLKNGKFRKRPSIHFAYKPTLDSPHFLFSPPDLDKDLHLPILVKSLGYDRYNLLDYEGKDVFSMFECIERGTQLVPEPLPVYLPVLNGGVVAVKDRNGIIDYSHAEERRDYAEKIFTSNTRQYFSVTCDGSLLDDGANNISQGRGSKEIEFLSSMEFRSSGNTSIEEMFKYLVTIGAVTLPVPEYMLNVSCTPTNSITIDKHTYLPPRNDH